jgi:hypothetical protein
MDTSRLHDEISVRLLAAAAPDDVLVAAAKLPQRIMTVHVPPSICCF